MSNDLAACLLGVLILALIGWFLHEIGLYFYDGEDE